MHDRVLLMLMKTAEPFVLYRSDVTHCSASRPPVEDSLTLFWEPNVVCFTAKLYAGLTMDYCYNLDVYIGEERYYRLVRTT